MRAEVYASQCNLSLEYGGDPSSNLGRGIRNLFIHLFFLLNMAIGFTAILITITIIVILILVRVKKLKHEIIAVFMIALLLFGVFSFTLAFKGQNVSIKDMPGLENAAKIYFLWFGNAVDNVKIITTNAIHMNWQGNKTA